MNSAWLREGSAAGDGEESVHRLPCRWKSNDARVAHLIDLPRVFLFGANESGPGSGEPYFGRLSGFFVEFFGVLHKISTALMAMGTVNEYGHPGNLAGFHEFLDEEQEFLCALYSESRDDHRAATNHSLRNDLCQMRSPSPMGWRDCHSRFHHQISGSSFFPVLRVQAAWGVRLHWDPPMSPVKRSLRAFASPPQKSSPYLSREWPGADKTERKAEG